MIDFDRLIALGILSGTTHWLIARAEISRPIWSRARGWLGKLLACPACSGWWLGLGFGVAGIVPLDTPYRALDVLTTGVLAVFATPVAQAALVWALNVTAINAEPDDEG